MQNRFLLLPPRTFAVCTVLLLSLCTVRAQQVFFNFTPPNPAIGVGADCMGMVSSGMPPTVTPITMGAVITQSEFSSNNNFAITDPYPLGFSKLVKWMVADDMGHSAEFEFGVTFVDLTSPKFDSLATLPILEVNSIAEVPALGPIPITDNCSTFGGITQNFFQTMPPPLCAGGSFTRTWTATDEAGNFAIYTQYITVYKDTLVPTVTVAPVNGSAPCATLPGSYTSWLSAQMAAFTAVDPSGIKSYTNNAPPALAACPDTAPVTVIFKATDNCNFFATRTATFSSSDTAPPVVNSPPVDTVAYCGNHLAAAAAFIHTHAYAQVTDACATNLTWEMQVNGVVRDSAAIMAILQDSINTSVCGVKLIGSQSYAQVRGYVRIDFSAKDPCGNGVFVGQGVLGILDTTPPVITGTNLTTETCGGGNDQTVLNQWINAHGNASLTDQCSPSSWDYFTFTTSNGQSGTGNFNTGPYPIVQANNCTWFTDVTFFAVDQCDNTASRTLRFQLADNIPPVIGGFPDTTVVYCPNPIPTPTATVTDNCSTGLTATYTAQYADTTCVGNYSYKVFWTVTDQCGNTANRTQIFVIRDTVGPTFTLLPPPITVACDSVNTVPAPVLGVTVTATDPCGSLQGMTMSTASTQNPDPNQCGHYNYTITRLFTATDQCGNTRTAAQVVTVQDVKGPTSAIPLPDTVILCQNLPLVAAIPPAIDQCSAVVGPVTQLSQTIVAGNCPDNYTIVVTWQATDVCNNQGTFSRNHLVRDTIRPTISNIPLNVTVECDAIPVAPSLSSLPTSDNCDNAPTVVFSETEMRDPNTASCNHWSNYQIIRTWAVTDACSNTRTYSQTISVMDNTPPEFEVKDTIDLPNTPGLCGANILPPTPLAAYDLCAVLAQNAVLLDTAAITGPPLSDAVCDTVHLALNSTNLPPLQPVSGDAALTIYLDNADAEGAEEFFRVYGENGVLLGQTTPVTPMQCGNGSTTFTIQEALLNDWLSDGQLTLTLAPNGTGDGAINPICPGRRVRAKLDYLFLSPQIEVDISYKIDNGAAQPYPSTSTQFLSTGTHTIVYTATDCIGNSVTASTIVTIEDIEPPVIAAPAAQTTYVGNTNCSVTWTLPLPGINENCNLSGVLSQSSPLTNTPFVSNANAGLVPKELTLSIAGLIPNAFENGTLVIRHRGDNGDIGEFFRVFDEQNNSLSVTTRDTSGNSCLNFHETYINVTATQINTWAADGIASFKLVANTDAINFSDFINPCGSLNPGGFDGTSAAQAVLNYPYGQIGYTILDQQSNVVQTGQVIGQQSTVTLPAGAYTVQYNTNDQYGNPAQAAFALMVRDTVRPKAQCQNIAIFVSVAGDNPYTLSPEQINNGSTDNCSAVSLSLSQTLFTCNQSGQIVPVTLTVTDTSGNTAQCTASVSVNTEMIEASSTANICEGGMAQLFCDPPGSDNNYTFKWSNVTTGYSSMLQNPVLTNVQLNQEGTYMVTVTGPTGCTAVGETQLQLIGLPFQPVLNISQNVVCLGQSLTLTTAAYTGTDVSYVWYRGSIDTIVATTLQPNLVLTNPPTGIRQYFVRIIDLNCGSALSAPKTVNVQVPVAATVAAASLNPCEGDPIVLGTTIQGSGITYLWTGPNSFNQTAQYPAPFPATLTNGGTYTLTISANGCPGTPAQVSVTVRDRPDAPTITGTSGVCEGATIQLSAQPAQANPFLWVSPALDTVNTGTSNMLTLNSVTQADSGYWKVIAILNGCMSPVSIAQLVAIQTYPVAVITGNSPVCYGSALSLSAQVNQPVASYTWAGPPLDGFTALGTANVVDNNPSTGAYTVTVATSFGCSSSATFNVQVVNPPVIASITSNAPVCVDGSVPVQLSPTLASTNNGPYSYTWTYPNGVTNTDPSPIINGATSANNGPYTLTVKDVYGCVSAPLSTTLSMQMIPVPPVLAQATPLCEGESINITVSNNAVYPANATYIWHTPTLSNFETNNPVFPIVNATLADGGTYLVQVRVGDCTSQLSSGMQFNVNKRPSAPDFTVTTPVCQGDTIYFEATVTPGVVVDEWNWSGPLEFSASAGNSGSPFRYPALLGHAGMYDVYVVTTDGCQSATSKPIGVEVKPQPQQPSILANIAICMQQADTLTMQVASGTQTNLATYTWYSSLTQSAVSSPSFSPVFKITDFSGYLPGQNSFYVIAELDGCTSVTSPPVSIGFDVIPNALAQVQTDSLGHCALLSSVDLLAIPPATNITGLWSQLSGPPTSISNPSSVFALASGLLPNNTYQFLWTLSRGACENFSQDTMLVSANPYEAALAMPDTTVCSVSEITLTATQGQYQNGYWTQPMGQASITNPKIEIVTPNNDTTLVTGLRSISSTQRGFLFIWTMDNKACGLSTDTVEIIPIYNRATTQPDTVQCAVTGQSQVSAAQLLPFETGLWSSPDPDISITNPSAPTTEVSNLADGPNLFIWETNGGLCGSASRDTLTITLELQPIANNDAATVPFGNPIMLDLAANDVVPNNYIVEILTPPNTGILTPTGTTGSGTYTYIPDVTFAGEENVLYRVCNVACLTLAPNEACAVAELVLQVNESTDCVIPTVITPNGDNINDNFFIPCLGCADCENDSELTIFNQWGDMVFNAAPYKQDWEGTYNGAPLPVGSYYYVLRYPSAANLPNKSGFILIQR